MQRTACAVFITALFCVSVRAGLQDAYSNSLAKICRPVDRPLDVLFVIDGSGSVGGSTFDMQLQMLNRIIDLVNISDSGTQIGVLQYASYTYTEFTFKTHKSKEALRAAIHKIHHKSGTTKTGKALDKAYQLFNDENSGVRKRNQSVAKVAIVVSDGHSHDDPVPKAKKLRATGVNIIALGIGPHINMNELDLITDNADYAFQNLTSPDSINRFVTEFKKLAIGEECKFARGDDGAEVKCHSDSIEVGVSTSKLFEGHLYVKGQFYDPNCNVRSNSTDVTLRIGLTECGIKRQFSVNPRGFLFESQALLQFHPHYNTPLDKTFTIKCFYQDKSHEEEGNEIDWELIKEHAQLKSSENRMPCEYKIVAAKDSTADCALPTESLVVGDAVIHKWQCNSDNFDTYQSVLVHSCFIMDVRNDIEKLIIDERGCSLDESVMNTPVYADPLTVSSAGIIVRHPDGPLVKVRCSLRFCDRLMGECDELLPPQCGPKTVEKRQAGIPIGIRPLEETTELPRIVTFDHSKINKTKGLRRRLNLDQNVRVAVSTVGVEETQNLATPLRHADVKLNTRPVKIVEREEVTTATPKTPPATTATTTSTLPPEFEEYSVEVDDTEVSDSTDAIKTADDPFQKYRKLNNDEQAALERELLNILPELDEAVAAKMNTNEIIVESQLMSVQTVKPQTCAA